MPNAPVVTEKMVETLLRLWHGDDGWPWDYSAEEQEGMRHDMYATLKSVAPAIFEQGRLAGLKEAAAVAKAHKGSAAKKRRERGIKLSSMEEWQQQEVIAEERGEDIAADIITRAIRALMEKSDEHA